MRTVLFIIHTLLYTSLSYTSLRLLLLVIHTFYLHFKILKARVEIRTITKPTPT